MADDDTPPIPASPVVGADERPRTSSRGKAAPSQRPLLTRLLPFVIVALALGSFSGIVGYYYITGSSSHGPDGAAPLVKAEAKPEKIRPENPGGMEVPHQDKEIYDRVVASGGRSNVPPTAERLLPPPETPLPRPGAPIGTAPNAPSTLAAAPPRPAGALPGIPDPVPAPPAPQQVMTSPPPAPPVAAAPPLAAQVPAPPVPAVTPRPVAPATSSGGIRVAIASVRTEADAHREWERLRRQYPDTLAGVSADFVPADLGDRGVFWRIYVGPPESNADAQARCNALKQRQISCFVARQ